MKNILILSVLFLFSTKLFATEAELDKARKVYYKSTKEEEYVESAFKHFEKLKSKYDKYDAISMVYLGSLTMLKGRYAFWPKTKLSYVNKGINIMDKGLKMDPDNIESLFIYGSSCYFLPFFLGKKDNAEEKLKYIIDNLNKDVYKKYDNEILLNALEFIIEYIELTDREKNKVNKFLRKLSSTN